MEKEFTIINHIVRKKLRLTLTEYCLADSIYHLSNSDKNKADGWCYASKETLAEFLGITRKSTINLMNKLIAKKIIEKRKTKINGKDTTKFSKYLKTTKIWDEIVIHSNCEESSQFEDFIKINTPTVNKVHSNCEESSQATVNKVPQTVKKVHRICEESSQYKDSIRINKDINKDSNKDITAEQKKEPEFLLIKNFKKKNKELVKRIKQKAKKELKAYKDNKNFKTLLLNRIDNLILEKIKNG